jgi:hypothetical protein
MDDGTRAAWLSFSTDMNADGEFTFTDVWLWIVHVFFMPGDAVIWSVLSYAPWLARFLELGASSYGGLFSAIVSVVIWLFGLVMAGAVYSVVLEFDRALTGRLSRYYRGWLRRARVARIWLSCNMRRLLQRLSLKRRRVDPEIGLDELDLDDLEIEALRSHALLAPGYVLSVSDLAASLEIRRGQAQQLLTKLEKLALLQRGFGASDGETGYRLSRPGQFVLMARSRIAGG